MPPSFRISLSLLVSLLAFLSSHVEGITKTPMISKPDWGVYMTGKGALDAVKKLGDQFSSVMKLETRKEASDAYSSEILIVTLDTGRGPANKLRALLSFGEHGREIITTEVALPLLEDLAKRYAAFAALPASEQEAREKAALEAVGKGEAVPLDVLLPLAMIKVLPLENMNGRDKVESGEYCERKNGRGVDVNRNFPVDWGKKERDYDPKEEYPGTGPLSEPEARLLKALTAEFRQHCWVATHSGMEALFLPYDHKNEVPQGPGPAAQLAILKQLNQETCEGRCAVGPGGKTVGYLAHGTVTDWMFVEGGVPFSSTWEIFGDFNAPYEDCYRMFNPLTKEGHDAVVGRWHRAFVRLLELLPTHPDIRAAVAGQGQGQGGQAPSPAPTTKAAPEPAQQPQPQPQPVLVPSSSAPKNDGGKLVQELFGSNKIVGGATGAPRALPAPSPTPAPISHSEDSAFNFNRLPSVLQLVIIGIFAVSIGLATSRAVSRRGRRPEEPPPSAGLGGVDLERGGIGGSTRPVPTSTKRTA